MRKEKGEVNIIATLFIGLLIGIIWGGFKVKKELGISSVGKAIVIGLVGIVGMTIEYIMDAIDEARKK